jgi:hypothetical protein
MDLRNIVATLLIAAAMYVFVVSVETPWLYGYVGGVPSASIQDWLADFRTWSNIAVGGSLLVALAWYFLARWRFRADQLPLADRRPCWMLCFLVCLAVGLLAIFATPMPDAGAWLAIVFYLVNATAVFYFSSALFSPSGFKFTPLGALSLRRWR